MFGQPPLSYLPSYPPIMVVATHVIFWPFVVFPSVTRKEGAQRVPTHINKVSMFLLEGRSYSGLPSNLAFSDGIQTFFYN